MGEITTVVTEGLGGGFTFEVRFEDLKKITAADGVQAGNNSVVTVEYESVLNEGAVIGGAGNPQYNAYYHSNNPNGEGKAKPRMIRSSSLPIRSLSTR